MFCCHVGMEELTNLSCWKEVKKPYVSQSHFISTDVNWFAIYVRQSDAIPWIKRNLIAIYEVFSQCNIVIQLGFITSRVSNLWIFITSLSCNSLPNNIYHISYVQEAYKWLPKRIKRAPYLKKRVQWVMVAKMNKEGSLLL